MVVFRVSGKIAVQDFSHEGGGYRFQRVPPTEKNGRRQTSTITISVLQEPTEAEVCLNDWDLDWQATRGSGAGGQARNKTSSAIQMTHRSSGVTVRVESERSQHQNLQIAKTLLRARLIEYQQNQLASSRNQARRDQIGGGARGDKTRTISLFRDQALDHRTGQRTSARRYLQGFLEDLW